ncbi:MAG: Crp/Fnr family transcriptional regulator [Bacteroidia bacterium]|nr:Crp/Fnr family transcriptional regulator [Bacteroidia bacterium]
MKAILQSFQLLTEEEIEAFQDMLVPKRLKKGEYFIQEGRVCREIAFISSGFFRSYYFSSSGEELTYCFTFQQSFLAAYSSFITQEPTQENIQAMMEVEMLTISREKIIALENSSSNWLKVFKRMAEEEYVKMEKRIFLLQKESAETKYQDLLKHHPDYLNLIPLNYLASYLGITQRHLSRIRASAN